MNNKFMAGVDGWGNKTECLLSDERGKIIGNGFVGVFNPRNQGLGESVKDIAESLRGALGKRKRIINFLKRKLKIKCRLRNLSFRPNHRLSGC